RPPLANQIRAGDAAVDHAVLHVLGNVCRANEEHIDGRIPTRERERALTGLLRAEAGVLEQRDARLAQPSLRRHGDRQTVVFGRRRLRRSSTSLYPPSPCRSQNATRVTVVVDACVRLLTSRYGSPSSSRRTTCQRCAIASSSDSVQRSRRNRPTSSAERSDAIASK